MSLSKFVASLAHGSQELTLALASLNFDVSLVKLEAPKECKEAAEDGAIHASARKLQALFGPILPQTPNLFRVYGLRASEIAKAPTTDAKLRYGPFAEHSGIDGGSLWAAATSGNGAVAVHLLGCMLARMFTNAEATSIWEEIVDVRKKEILGNTTSSDIFAELAARHNLSREDLADWDASARAWLSSADEAMGLKHKQLNLIIGNINVPVNLKGSTYESVIQAWVKAMTVMDKLVEGVPHSIIDGSVLLAISAWHIYPDMSVLSQKNEFVAQKDPLISRGAVLTLGLESTIPRHNADFEGVSWSLPLACYKYYGPPAHAEKTLHFDGSRLSISQLILLSVGSIMSGWTESSLDTLKATELVAVVSERLCNDKLNSLAKSSKVPVRPSDKSWLARMGKEARSLLDSDKDQILHDEGRKLVEYGRKRCAEFLGFRNQKSQIARLQEPEVLFSVVVDTKSRIRLLRQFASRMKIEPKRLLIRYAIPGSTAFGYASIAVTAFDTTGTGKMELFRWEPPHANLKEPNEQVLVLQQADIVRAPVRTDTRFFWVSAPLQLGSAPITISVDDFFGKFAESALYKRKVDKKNPRKLTGVPFHLFFGDPATAAIFIADKKSSHHPISFKFDDVIPAIRDDEFIQLTLLQHMIGQDSVSSGNVSEALTSLRALATVADVYSELAGATISKSCVKHCLGQAKWLFKASSSTTKSQAESLEARSAFAFEPFEPSRAAKFACVSRLESGTIDILPEGLEAVMAMASGNSLFVSSSLPCDPIRKPDAAIIRIQGNIGRAGVAMLLPPSHRPKQKELDDWKFLDNSDFDGQLMDCFQGTSLHLSFSGFSLPVDTGKRGTRYTEIVLLETVISVHHQGRWIADLDILPSLDSMLCRQILCTGKCTQHSNDKKAARVPDLITMDSWDEFLDRPSRDAVVRACGNWEARLAACALNIARDNLTIVLGKNPCWACAEAERERFRHKKPVTYVV